MVEIIRLGELYKPPQIHQRLTNAAGNVPKSSKVLPDDNKSSGTEIHNKIIPRANHNSRVAATPDDNGEQPLATDDNNNDGNEKYGSKKAAPLPKVAIRRG